MEWANPVATLLDPNTPIEPNPNPSDDNQSNSFAQLLGKLQYIANTTQPDISFAINRLASYTANSSTQHYGMLKRILRYLVGMHLYGIIYRKSYRLTLPLIGYTDTAFSNADEKKLMTELVFLSAGGAILWKSKKQTIIALSMTEAEYIVLAHIRTEA